MLEVILIVLFTLFFTWIACWRLDWAITLCVLLLPTYLLRFQVGFLPMTVLEVMVLVVFVVWLLKTLNNELRTKNKTAGVQSSTFVVQGYGWPWKWLIIFWVLAGIVAVLISPDTRQALGLWKAYILEPILFFMVFVNTIKTARQTRAIIWAFGVLVVIVGFIALLQYAGLLGISFPYGTQTPMRATSVFPFPTAIGKLLGPIVALFLGIVLARGSKGKQGLSGEAIEKKQALLPYLFPWGVLAFGAMALLFSFSRGAIIGVFASLIFISFFSQWKKWLWGLIVIVIILSLAVPFTRHEIFSIVSTKDTSADVHMVMWKGAVRIIKASPITGTGLASFPVVYEKYKEASHVEFFPNPDELYLTLWIEMGLAGLALFAWITVRFFWEGARVLRDLEPGTLNQEPDGMSSKFKVQSSKLAVALMAAMVAVLVHGFFDTPYFKNDLAIAFWALVGLMVVLSKLDEAKKRSII
jgi:O-antigen ligase